MHGELHKGLKGRIQAGGGGALDLVVERAVGGGAKPARHGAGGAAYRLRTGVGARVR